MTGVQTCALPISYLLLFGGNNGTVTLNDVWVLNLDNETFVWTKFDTPGPVPPPRVYHSATFCNMGRANGMMVIFGGRSENQTPLQDAWGLRRHRDGHWDWICAPCKAKTNPPLKRYQHIGIFLGPLMFVVGGRTTHAKEQVGLEIYDTETSEWFKFKVARRFRHACWATTTDLSRYGGFEYDAPIFPTNTMIKIQLTKLLEKHPELSSKIANLLSDTTALSVYLILMQVKKQCT